MKKVYNTILSKIRSLFLIKEIRKLETKLVEFNKKHEASLTSNVEKIKDLKKFYKDYLKFNSLLSKTRENIYSSDFNKYKKANKLFLHNIKKDFFKRYKLKFLLTDRLLSKVPDEVKKIKYENRYLDLYLKNKKAIPFDINMIIIRIDSKVYRFFFKYLC